MGGESGEIFVVGEGLRRMMRVMDQGLSVLKGIVVGEVDAGEWKEPDLEPSSGLVIGVVPLCSVD